MDTVMITDAKGLHRKTLTVDAHCDALFRVVDGERQLGERSDLGQFDFPRALEGGLTAALMAISGYGMGARGLFKLIDVFYDQVDAYPDQALHALRADDIPRAKELGKVALVLSMEGATGLEGDLGVLRVCYRLGLRVLGITWNRRNEAADGVGELRTRGGLTRFGVDLVQECNRLGIIIDLAHLAPAGVEDVLKMVDLPVVATHANCYALWPHPRNLTDAQLEAIAKCGGVVGVTPVPAFLGEDEMRSHLSVLLDHIDHIVRVIGLDGAGIGLDFDGAGDVRTEGIEEISQLGNLTTGLAERGYSAQAIGKIMGGNFMRVLQAVL